ncbi:MAG: hypothetical protein P8J27_02235 [Mariniblastus sp.]|nr:hypothetical protein [Mariniblastus sp.]
MVESESQPSSIFYYLWLIILITVGIVLFLIIPATQTDRNVAARTVLLGLSASMVAIPIGGLIAWVCRSRGMVGRSMLLATIAMLMVPMFIHVSAWDAAFGKLGWLTSSQGQVLVPLVSGWTAAVWIHGIAAAPQVALILLIGMSIGSRDFEEQALLDTSSAGVFWHVTFKRLWPLLILSTIWITVSCAREIAVTDIYQIGTLAEQIYLGYSLGINSVGGNWSPNQLAEAGEIGPRLTIAIIAWLTLISIFLFIKLTDIEYESHQIQPQQSRRATWKQNLTGILVLMTLVGVPIGNVILRACFFVRPINGVATQSYSIGQLFAAVKKSTFDYQDEFMWSGLIALTSATLILAIATLFAWTARQSRRLQVVFAISLAITCAAPGPYIGTFLSGLFSNLENGTFLHWLYNYTIAAPVLANFLFCWPFGALIVWFVFRKIPSDSMENAIVEGAGWSTRFLQFGIAANKYAIIGCWLISFAFCFGELSASHIVRPAGMDTVPRKMLGDLHAGVNEMTAGITIVTASTIVFISLVGWTLIWLNRSHNGRK